MVNARLNTTDLEMDEFLVACSIIAAQRGLVEPPPNVRVIKALPPAQSLRVPVVRSLKAYYDPDGLTAAPTDLEYLALPMRTTEICGEPYCVWIGRMPPRDDELPPRSGVVDIDWVCGIYRPGVIE